MEATRTSSKKKNQEEPCLDCTKLITKEKGGKASKTVEREGEKQIDSGEDEKSSILQRYLLCGQCDNLVVHAVTTVCEHVFCEVCLLEGFVFMPECMVCGMKIRGLDYAKNIFTNNMVSEALEELKANHADPSVENQFFERRQVHDKYLAQKKLAELKVGMKLDAQDTAGLWRSAKITKLNTSPENADINTVCVKFDGLTKKASFKLDSYQMATLGFYTKRQNIPKMNKGKMFIHDPEDEGQVWMYAPEGNLHEEE